jgi:hypothetical protein
MSERLDAVTQRENRSFISGLESRFWIVDRTLHTRAAFSQLLFVIPDSKSRV